jgi:proteasome lid subunit RPN8/RPN11
MTHSTETLTLPRPLINTILTHAQKSPDMEVCGLISEDSSQEKYYYPISNVAAAPEARFLMDGPEQIAAMKQMRERGQTLLAIVHSHPKAAAIPSQQDIADSSYKALYYLITSLNTKGVLELRAYRQLDNGMQEIELILE